MAKKPKPAKFLPMPLLPLFTCQALISADGRIYRAVTCLAVVYWMTGCRPLPTETHALAALVRMPQANFTPIRSDVDQALSELFPVLNEEYEAARKNKEALQAMARYAGTFAKPINDAKRRQRTQSGKIISAAIPDQPRSIPAKHLPYKGDGRTDLIERTAAIARQHATTITPPERGRLAEAPSSRRK